MVSSETDALGTAMADYQRHGELLGECVYRDGAARQDADVEAAVGGTDTDRHG